MGHVSYQGRRPKVLYGARDQRENSTREGWYVGRYNFSHGIVLYCMYMYVQLNKTYFHNTLHTLVYSLYTMLVLIHRLRHWPNIESQFSIYCHSEPSKLTGHWTRKKNND